MAGGILIAFGVILLGSSVLGGRMLVATRKSEIGRSVSPVLLTLSGFILIGMGIGRIA
jgi:hypothetical protein